MVMCFNISVFANTENHIVSVEDAEVKSDFSEKNIAGYDVNFKIDENIIEKIKGDDIEKILKEGLGTINTGISIISEKSLEEKGIDFSNRAFYIYTSSDKLVGMSLSDKITSKDLDIIIDLADNVAEEADIINLDDVVTIEQPYENDSEVINSSLSQNTIVGANGITYYIENGKNSRDVI